MTTGVRKDWFGLAGFDPGASYMSGRLYLLGSVGSTRDFLLGRQRECLGRLCRWRGWGWQAGALRLQASQNPSRAGTLVVARRQSRGRGRQGRPWFDLGGLHLSWCFRVQRAVVTAGLAVWSGLIVALVLGERFGVAVDLKWPNDLMIAGRKVGGLLFDVLGSEGQPLVVAGLGVNLLMPRRGIPDSLRGRATSLEAETGRLSRPAAVAGPVLARLADELPAFAESGWAPYAAHLARRDWLRGRDVCLRSGNDTICGVATGIAADGALLVRQPDGREHRLLAGDVHITEATTRSEKDREPCSF